MIKCNANQRDEIVRFISEENEKLGGKIKISKTEDGIAMEDLIYTGLNEEDAANLFRKIKESFTDIEIEGFLLIGDDNHRNQFYFHSDSGSKDVNVEYTVGGDDMDTGVPFSKCWFSFLSESDYGSEPFGFVTREDFEEFIDMAKEYAEEQDMSLEELIDSEEDFSEFICESEVGYYGSDEDIPEWFGQAWAKYKGVR